MKFNRINILYISALLLFAAYMISADYIFNNLITVEKEARISKIELPAETQDIICGLDNVKRVNTKWKDVIFINGWVFKINVKDKNRDVYLLLKSQSKTLCFKIENDSLYRPDVTEAYGIDVGVNNHGFEILVPLFRLKNDAYKIGFVIEDETGKYFSMTNTTLEISKNGSVSLIESGNATPYEKEYVFHQTTVSIQKPTREVNFGFETIKHEENSVKLSGWCFLKGMDATFQTSYLLLKKEGKVHVFEMDSEIREDVTKYFNELKLNLDSSGFITQISMENFEKGNYKIGIYIKNGDQAGMIFSKKYISNR
jgi:hypothetical protein